MAVLTYLELKKHSISQLFYRHAKFCATHQVYVIVAAIFLVLPLCYPALNAYYLNPLSDVPTFYWELPSSRVPISKSSFKQKCGTQPSLHVESIIIKTEGFRDNNYRRSTTDGTNVLEKNLFLWTLQLQERLSNTVVIYPPNKTSPLISRQEPEKYTLSSLCFKPNGESRCLVHSPIEFWNYDAELLMNDKDISKTLLEANEVSSFKIPIPLKSVFGNPVYDKLTGKIVSADSIILTYYLDGMGECAEDQTLAIWDLLWNQVMNANDTCHIVGERIKGFDIDFKDTSTHIVFDFNRSMEFPAEFFILALEHLVVFLYISLSLGRLNSVKSKFGLAFSTVVQVFVSFVISLSVCSLFGVTLTLVSWPFVLVIVGVENMFVLTNAVTSTSMELDVKERVGKGLEKVGASMTKALFSKILLVALICSVTNINSVQEFCIFTSVAMIVDYLLQMSFFITTLSIDLRRLEISDLYNRRVSTPLTPTKTLKSRNANGAERETLMKSSNHFSNGRIAISLLVTTSLYQENGDLTSILSSIKNMMVGSNQSAVENNVTTNTFYETPTASANSTESTELLGWKLLIRSIIKNFVFGLKFIILPAFGIFHATSSLVRRLVSSDQIDKGETSNGGNNANKIPSLARVVTLRGRHSADVSLLCANPNGMIISTATDKHITSWDGKQGNSMKKLERYMRKCDSCKCGITGGMKKCISWPVRAMCMSEKVELAAAGFEDGVVRVWDINSGQATYILKDTVEDVESVMSAVSGNTAKERVTCLQFVVPTSSSSIPQTPTYELNYMNFTTRPISIQQAPSILLATYRNGYFREWDLVSGQIVHTIATNQKGGINYLCVVDDGELDYNQDDLYIFTGARDGSVKCWVRKVYYPENESNITINPYGVLKSRWKSIYTIPGEPGNAITCIATKVVKTVNNTYGVVITGALDGEVRVYDYINGKPIAILSRGTISKQRREKEREQQLLQKRLLIHQQKQMRQFEMQTNFFDDEFDDYEYDETEDTDDEEDELSHKDSIISIVINLLKQESCPCGNTEYGGFSIVTSSADEKVHVWHLVRNVMDCTCMALRVENNLQNNVTNNAPVGLLQQKDVAEWDGVVSYHSKFIGRVCQPGGTAIVLLRDNIVGVRKVKHSLASKHGIPRCHGAEGEWEMWMLEINDPRVIESTQDGQENSDNEVDVVELLVRTIPLVSESDLFTEQQQKKKKEALKRRDKESTGELTGFVRRRRNHTTVNKVVGPNFGPTFPISLPSNMHQHDHHDDHEIEDTQGQVVDYRQKSQRRRGSVLHRVYPNNERSLSLLEEEDEMNEILPFVHVRQVVKIGDYGVAAAYGNFVKVVLFEESGDYEIVPDI
ncbi:9077_t:CDS:2 [Funneliformis caledonium]|uniref:Sterol regulatory element-binding protein cleavage-activating protein n=1 Tax=Funneliformis caledonium TaxID=1117310 RepID=A0A9N8V6E6_9GLOM|nr:9077_t:CDS:2 [Funneliformis caledonium]